MPTYLPLQAQKFVIAQQNNGTKMRTKDINSIHHFVMNISLTMSEAGISFSNIYNTFTVLYPMIGTTSTSHAFNLIDPGTSSVSNYFLTYVGNPTHSEDAINFGGINSQYVNTNFLASSLSASNFHLSYYSTNNATNSYSDITTGFRADSLPLTNGIEMSTYWNANNETNFYDGAVASGGYTLTTTIGLSEFGRKANSTSVYNGTSSSAIGYNPFASILPAKSLLIGCATNSCFTASNITGVYRNCGLMSAGLYHTFSQYQPYSNAVYNLIANKGQSASVW
jgi:hypothetical protein